jgi:SAM-dependent methyltransferase
MQSIISQFLPGPPPPVSQLLDFGCGNMPYRSLFEPRVQEYIGCDLPGNEQAECILEMPDRLPFAEGSASVVLSSSVLEHVVDPSTYLVECHRVLRDEGLLILSTHGMWRYHPDPLDLWRWTSDGLKRVVREAGFSILRFRGLLGPAAAALQLWQDATLERVPRFFRTLFTWFMQGRIRATDRRCSAADRDADASVYLLVARKSLSGDTTQES